MGDKPLINTHKKAWGYVVKVFLWGYRAIVASKILGEFFS